MLLVAAVLAACTGSPQTPQPLPTGPSRTGPPATGSGATGSGATGSATTRPGASPAPAAVVTTGPAAGAVTRIRVRTGAVGRTTTLTSGPAPVLFDVTYRLQVSCTADHAAGRRRATVAIVPQRVDMGGQVDPPAFGSVDCSGRPTGFVWRSDTSGPLTLQLLADPAAGSLTGTTVSAELTRPAGGTAQLATAAPNARGAGPPPPLATPAPASADLLRVTETAPGATGDVVRGRSWSGQAACRAVDPGRRLVWSVDPAAGGDGSGDGNGSGDSIASGSVACDGHPVDISGVWAVTGPVLLHIEADAPAATSLGGQRRGWVVVRRAG